MTVNGTHDTATEGRDGDTVADRLARYYDLDLLDDPGDLDLYLAMATRTGGPILELAAGSGRLALPLARAGHRVTAVDHDPAMLRRAAAGAGTATTTAGLLDLVEADLTSLDLGRRFGLAFIALNSLLLLPGPAAQRQAIRVLARHLRPGGVAIVDTVIPDAADLAGYDGRLTLDWIRDDPQTGETVSKTSSARHDAATATVALTSQFDAWPATGTPIRRTIRHDELHLRNAADIVQDALDAGLEPELLAGDHQGTQHGPGSERFVLVAVSV